MQWQNNGVHHDPHSTPPDKRTQNQEAAMTDTSDFALHTIIIAVVLYLAIFVVGPVWLALLYVTIEIFSYFPLMWVLAPLAALQGVLVYFWMYPKDMPKRMEFLKRDYS